MGELSDELNDLLSGVNWTEPYSDLVRQLPQVYAGPNDPNRWARGYAPLPSQTLFHELNTFYKGFSGPVGSGKSNALCREAIRLAFLNPGCSGLLGAPTYEMLADVTLPALLEELDNADIPYKWRAGRKIVYLPGPKVKIYCRSLLDPRKRVGLNLAWAAIDELTFCPEESWGKIEARLRHPKAKRKGLIAVWTPRGYDWVWNLFVNPAKREKYPEHGCVLATPRENFHLGPEYYDRLEASYDERLYKQEVLGVYLNIFVGQAYYAFDRNKHIAPQTFEPGLQLCWTMDFNVGQMSSLIAQYVPGADGAPKEVRILDEIILFNSNTFRVCDEFGERLDALIKGTQFQFTPISIDVYGDAAGEARTSKADKTDYQIIREWASRNANRVDLSFHVQSANPGVRSRIASVNAMLLNQRGEVRTLIDGKCTHLLDDLEQVGWALDRHKNYTGELDKSKPHLTHPSDALGYLIFKIAGIKQYGGPVETTNLRF